MGKRHLSEEASFVVGQRMKTHGGNKSVVGRLSW